MKQPSELSLQEESRLLSEYAAEPVIRAMLAIDLFIRRAAHRLLAASNPRDTEAS